MTERTFVEILKARIDSDPDLTVSGLASAADLDNSTIRQMIKFNRSPRIDTAFKICRALGETVEGFLSGARDPVTAEILFHLEQLSDSERRILLSAVRGIRVHDHEKAK